MRYSSATANGVASSVMPYLTTDVAAERLGVSRGRVLALIRGERLKAVKGGTRDWLIDEDDLAAFAAQPRRPGRPAKQTRRGREAQRMTEQVKR